MRMRRTLSLTTTSQIMRTLVAFRTRKYFSLGTTVSLLLSGILGCNSVINNMFSNWADKLIIVQRYFRPIYSQSEAQQSPSGWVKVGTSDANDARRVRNQVDCCHR